MKVDEILRLYQEKEEMLALAESIKASEGKKFQVKGLVGSQLAIIIGSIYRLTQKNIVVLVNDKEEALYLHNDLKSFMPKKEIFFFPASYKRPYQIEEVDNANVLQRAEVLNELNHTRSGRQVIITFAEALNEKIINKKTLVKNTLEIQQGTELGMDFVEELLEEYGFEREDYVYEPGQFAIRGGILDVFSFANDYPYRIEFFGQEIDSIRQFDPVSQMSDEKVKRISIIPNIQRTLLKEEKVSFLDYVSPKTLFFTQNIEFVEADLERMFKKAEESFDKLFKDSGGAVLSKKPSDLYYHPDEFRKELKQFSVVELTNKNYYMLHEEVMQWKGTAQPAFQKKFNLLADHLKANQADGIVNYIFSENEKQLTRLQEIFEEVDPEVDFQGVLGDIHQGFLDGKMKLACYTDHQIFERYHRYKAKANKERSQALTLKELRELKPGDYVVHVSHGIGKFAGLHTIKVGKHTQEAVKIMYKNDDAIFVNVNSLHKVSKYTGKDGALPKMSKLGSPTWSKAKAKTKSRIKAAAFNLVSLYAKRKAMPGFAYAPDNYMQRELEASFMYEDTPDQAKTTEEVKVDMEKPHPMDRLVCGDVGFGKTEIAIRAAFKAVLDGKQVAILVPTTILALQHYKTFKSRLGEMPVTVDYINRFKTNKEVKQTLEDTATGKVDILVGTHRLASKDVKFKDLGLLIIDEEQRFGVNVKDKLKTMKTNVDTLTLTATPIPRTLQFSLAGIRDLSVITTPPPNRQPIETVVSTFSPTVLRDSISYELKRGGQVFFIHPRVKDIEEVASGIKKLVPDARIKIAHGQMKGPDLEKVMINFIEGGFDILVATTIIESGLDIPNANTIIINEANKYGLAELHQMRGRVGRSNRKAFCYLIAPPEISLTQDARKRLKAMEEFSDLGSGFHIALRDLDIRGAGDLLGAEQSGFVAEIGYDMYHRILDEAVRELKEEHFGDLFAEEIAERKKIIVEDVKIDIDLEVRLPEMYVPSIPERLKFYRRIAGATTEEELREIQREMIDRFGPMDKKVLALFDATRVRETAKRIGVERVVLKGDVLRLYFVSNKESHFYQSDKFMRVIQFVQLFSARVRMKESEKFLSLIYDDVKSMKRVLTLLRELKRFVLQEKEEEVVG
ncbi:MAG: transcription-repair coupling factor [Bacteroidia bacterium]|nr:transcription-repair coupling factor [Bacteroidia bacterium]